jgi:hypothetical protein
MTIAEMGQEIDFPVTKKLGVPAILLVNRRGVSRTAMAHVPPVTVVSAEGWLAALP